MISVREICRLILAERKVNAQNAGCKLSHQLQADLLGRGIYLSRHDICECYRGYCETYTAAGWISDLSYWDETDDHIGPVDYIAARITK